MSVVGWFLVALGIYVGLFAAVLVDEMVLDTFWICRHIPDSWEELLRLIYAPLNWLLFRVTGAPSP